jgi:hypothetical protein
MGVGRILSRDLFLYLIDYEIKRARRFQNFFCVLKLSLCQAPGRKSGDGAKTYEKMNRLLMDELRESDLLGSLGDNQWGAILPYATPGEGVQAKSRVVDHLKYYDFKNEGYELTIDQICFPEDGTAATDVISRVTGAREAH